MNPPFFSTLGNMGPPVSARYLFRPRKKVLVDIHGVREWAVPGQFLAVESRKSTLQCMAHCFDFSCMSLFTPDDDDSDPFWIVMCMEVLYEGVDSFLCEWMEIGNDLDDDGNLIYVEQGWGVPHPTAAILCKVMIIPVDVTAYIVSDIVVLQVTMRDNTAHGNEWVLSNEWKVHIESLLRERENARATDQDVIPVNHFGFVDMPDLSPEHPLCLHHDDAHGDESASYVNPCESSEWGEDENGCAFDRVPPKSSKGKSKGCGHDLLATTEKANRKGSKLPSPVPIVTPQDMVSIAATWFMANIRGRIYSIVCSRRSNPTPMSNIKMDLLGYPPELWAHLFAEWPTCDVGDFRRKVGANLFQLRGRRKCVSSIADAMAGEGVVRLVMYVDGGQDTSKQLASFCSFEEVGARDGDVANGESVRLGSGTTVRMACQLLAVITINRRLRAPSKQVSVVFVQKIESYESPIITIFVQVCCRLFVTTAMFLPSTGKVRLPLTMDVQKHPYWAGMCEQISVRMKESYK